MIYIVFVCVLSAIVVDVLILRSKDRELHRRMFRVLPRAFALALLPLALIMCLQDHRAQTTGLFVVGFYLPLYIIRRRKFLNTLPPQALPSGSAHDLAVDALGVIFLWLFSATVISFVTQNVLLLFLQKEAEAMELIISAVVSSSIIMMLVYQASAKFSDRGFRTNMALRKGRRSNWTAILLPAVIGLSFAAFAAAQIINRPIQPQTPLSEILESVDSAAFLVAFLTLGVIVAPLVEEIIFRGYFYHVIRLNLGPSAAIYVIALSFAFLHVGQYWGDWLAIAMVGLLGFALTIMRALSGTTVTSVVMHYAYNAGVTVIPVVFLMLSNPAFFKYQTQYEYLDAAQKESLLIDSIAERPQNVDAYYELAMLYKETEELERSLDVIDKALRLAPEDEEFAHFKDKLIFELEAKKGALP